MKYHVLAYYLFTPIQDPEKLLLDHKHFFTHRDIKGRIYISRDGINGQMSASEEAFQEYKAWLREDSRFREIEFKIHTWHEHCFPRMTIKIRPQLVAFDREIHIANTGKHLSPKEWQEMLEHRDETHLLLDVRNQYEWSIGHFEGATLPLYETFRQFPQYVQRLKQKVDLKRAKVMMYCTGGIRCELYSAFMKEEGFEHVYQLQGGIIKYGLQVGTKHWKGKLFVFDDRLSVPISEEETSMISHCRHCGALTDFYFNCANMDCNELFLSCFCCAEKMDGCCCSSCQLAPRRRPFIKQSRPKPFRRMSHGTSS